MYERSETWTTSRAAVSGAGGVVAAQHWMASEAGAAILRAGGTAADAAIATALALGVCEPWMSGPGGSGLAVIWDAARGEAQALDFLGTLPAAIDAADYPADPREPENLMGYPGVRDRRNMVGGAAITVPGAMRGIAELHARYGRLPFAQLTAPATGIAEHGIPVDWHATLMIAAAMGDLRQFAATAEVFLPDGIPPESPTRLPVPALAETLKMLGQNGPGSFYSGRLAQSLVRDLNAAGSVISLEDLARYEAHWIPPLTCRRGAAELHTAGPSSGGPCLVDFFGTLEPPPRPPGPEAWAAIAAALRTAWRRQRATTGQTDSAERCTTHLSVCDRDGNMVALTGTLVNRFGSRLLLPGTGILMNNGVNYFHPQPGLPLSIEPGKRVNTSYMCPTIASKGGEGWFAIGASGASRIVPAVAQLAAFLIDFGMDLESALAAPRISVGPDERAHVDPRLGREVLDAVGGVVALAQRSTFPKPYACPAGVLRQDGVATAMADPTHPVAAGAAA